MGLFDKPKKENEKQKEKSTVDKVKTVRRMLPIIGAVLPFAFILIIGGIIVAAIPSIFLDYSDKAQVSDDLKNEYEEYWMQLCDDESRCSEEQIQAAKELTKSQEKFYKKLDSLSEKYTLTDEQKYIVLSTIFYNYDINSFTENTGAFIFDDDDEINYDSSNNGENVYKREQDSLKELIKQFKVNTAFCQYTVTGTDGNTESKKEVLRGANGSTFSFNFFENVQINLGINPPIDGFQEAKEECQTVKSGKVSIKVSSDSATSIEAYYRYLRESDYLDSREQIQPIFRDYAKQHGLSKDITTWTDEEKIVVREEIINDIKDIVAAKVVQKGTDDKTYLALGYDVGYWWPVGSSEVVESDGKLFATGTPHSYTVTSEAAGRLDPFTGKPSTHSGMDIAPGGSPGVVPAIAAKSGIVVFPPADANINYGQGSGINGSTYGNYVIIQHTDGNYTLYAHLHAGTIKVRAGESVEQGQVIGYIGTSGRSTGTHLHFEVREGQNSYYSVVDPRKYIEESDPRPQSSLDKHFIEWFNANFEGSTALDTTGTKYRVEDIGDGVRTVGPGVTLEAQKAKFEQRGINIDDYPVGSYLPRDLVDSIKYQVLDEAVSSIEATLSSAGLTLPKNQIEALVVFKFNVGNIVGFTDAYKKYGDTQALYDNYFGQYVHVKGEVWPGLVKRRQKEWELFHNNVYVE